MFVLSVCVLFLSPILSCIIYTSIGLCACLRRSWLRLWMISMERIIDCSVSFLLLSLRMYHGVSFRLCTSPSFYQWRINLSIGLCFTVLYFRFIIISYYYAFIGYEWMYDRIVLYVYRYLSNFEVRVLILQLIDKCINITRIIIKKISRIYNYQISEVGRFMKKK